MWKLIKKHETSRIEQKQILISTGCHGSPHLWFMPSCVFFVPLKTCVKGWVPFHWAFQMLRPSQPSPWCLTQAQFMQTFSWIISFALKMPCTSNSTLPTRKNQPSVDFEAWGITIHQYIPTATVSRTTKHGCTMQWHLTLDAFLLPAVNADGDVLWKKQSESLQKL